MHLQTIVADFYDVMDLIDTPERLSSLMSGLCGIAGIPYFALTHHVDFNQHSSGAVHLHNYPADFAQYYHQNGLMIRDPVHRVSQLRSVGFTWSTLPTLIPLTAGDTNFLQEAHHAGLGLGYTVPIHVPGEHTGSCSFAVAPAAEFPRQNIPLLEASGRFAFEAARRLAGTSAIHNKYHAHLTEREREIVILLGHDKSEKEIARILNISPDTVNDHLKHARHRFGVRKSMLLVICGLVTGAITWSDLVYRSPIPVFT
ncbi:MAG: LuxR family transcriptional regulator, partial [Cytophagaceae bacterium]